jgi:transposase
MMKRWCLPKRPANLTDRQRSSLRELLLNYFRARKQFSSGVIKGLNNKAKVTLGKAYGHRTVRIAELPLCHVLGKLPGPELAHKFL